MPAGNPLLKGKTKSGPNSLGKNGYDNGNWPDEDLLEAKLRDYATEQLTQKQRLLRLHHEFGLTIGMRTLAKLNKHFNIPSVRRPVPTEIADQLVLNKMSDLHDRHQRWGIRRTMDALAKDGTPVPRRIIREVKELNEPEAVDARYPGKKKIPRKNLTSFGPFDEINCDGHDKLGSLALKMGPVGLPIYGMKDKWSGAILHLVVVPNNRLATTIGHVYLDFVEAFKAIPIQITVDKGSETGFIYAFQSSLRETYSNINVEEITPFVALTSTHNIPIESCWHWFREQTGATLYHHITRGRDDGIFNGNIQLHIDLFNWIWPGIVQRALDEFHDSWNKHQIRRQPQKEMPSGSSPMNFFIMPGEYCWN
ncbi:hypothetical protein PHLCEN_2v89 [Hermanssonia centrifuga]|uniref:Integrase core domain-containing protein n=1 Tax=Hermanssonia centrifuga TaxID=98765 RepID=A0A2R6S703_9APHY|nr:hypothetical protein PHLCEN_2v89 [Hermanssonia centrifuga]